MGIVSLLLLAAGAVLVFAVTAVVEGVEITTLGVILMIVGGVGFVGSLLRGSFSSFHTERHVSPDGRHVVEERRTSGV